MLLSKVVKVKWHPKTKRHYESKGYVYTKMGDEFEVKVEDLSNGSNEKIIVQCDECKKILKPMAWQTYKKCIHEDGTYYCQECGTKLFGRIKMKQTRLKNGQSLGYWLIKNLTLRQAVSIISRWEDELNGKDIREVSYRSKGFDNKGYWFKCLTHIEHKSEIKSTQAFISNFNKNGFSSCLDCTACNSFAQWGYDNVDDKFLEKYWDYSKNIDKYGKPIDPWKISYGSNNIKVWIFCQDEIKKHYHGSYLINCNDFTNKNARCSYCNSNSGKVHPLDSLGQYIINKYGKEFLNRVWSDKNKKSAFKYSPMSHQEVWWKCLDGKHKDYYRIINESKIVSFRCAECVQERTESIIQEKVRLYLESLGYKVLHEFQCTLIPKNIIEPPNNSNKKRGKGILRYDNEIIINNNHLFIEVMGQQHDTLDNYYNIKPTNTYKTTPKQELEYLQAKDKYKEDYVYQQGSNYHYLAVWYYHFNKENTYKKLIDDKINEILIKEGVTPNE